MLLLKLFPGIGEITIHYLNSTVQVLNLGLHLLDYPLLGPGNPTDEVPVNLLAFVSLLLHVCHEGGEFFLGHLVVPEVPEGFHKLWVYGPFGAVIAFVVIRLELLTK